MNDLPAYVDELMKLLSSERLKPGSVTMIEIRHDPWCLKLSGKGPCICKPDIGVKDMAAKT